MLSVQEALQHVLARAHPLPPQGKALGAALGCVLTEEVMADRDLPPFDKALVDGFAVRSADLRGGGATQLKLGEEITAGMTPSRPLGAGEAALIMTGAPLPQGADAVVMLERVRRPEPGCVVIDDGEIVPGRNRLPRGREMRSGDLLIERGERLNPARLGLLASVGRVEVRVVPRPVVAIVPTGDELVEPDREPGPGQIRNSNATLLRALALAAGAEAEALPIAPDDPIRLTEALRRGLAADVLIVAGGVSAGTRDLVPAACEALDVTPVFHKVQLKPGKPLWFGVGPARGERPGCLVFGLPGNPVSGFVCFLLFVQPALEALAGLAPNSPPTVQARLAARFAHRGDRPTYHPARRVASDDASGDTLAVEPLDWAGSADLRTVAHADGFAIFPAGDRDYEPGETIGFLPML